MALNKHDISRRKFMKTLAAGSLAVNIIGCKKHKTKPNLLFIWTDQQRADTIKVYGNSKIHAPNLNKLADESVVFRNAYVSQPVCTPSRSTVMTGHWPHTNGCTENNIPLSPETHVLPEILNDPEYRTGYIGKWHLGDEIFAQHGFEEWISMEDGYSRYFSAGKDRDARSSYHWFLKDLGYKPNNEGSNRFSRSFAANLPLNHCKPKFLEQNAIDFLERYRHNPFMLYVNFLEPHPPFFGPLDELHEPAAIDLPHNFDDPLGEEEPLWYRNRQQIYLEHGQDEFDLKKQTDWKQLSAKYWGLVTQVDLSVGAILNKLENLGLADNTIVVFTSDHGDMMGSHHMLHKSVMYQEAVRVPWLIRIPQMNRRPNIIDGHVSHIDLVPTILDLMNAHKKNDLSGISLKPVMEGDAVDRDVMIEWTPNVHRFRPETRSYLPGISVEQVNAAKQANRRAVITQEGMKLVLADHDLCQLYDLNKDPYETTNLINDRNHKALIKEYTGKIVEWQQRTIDNIQIV
jgi:arylsulfatase A-like enzyme